MIYYNGSTANEKYVIHNNTYVPFALKNGTPIALFDDNVAPDFNNMTISNIDASDRILDTMFCTDPYYCNRNYNYAYSNSAAINTFCDNVILNERINAPYVMRVNSTANAYRPVFFANNFNHGVENLNNFALLGIGPGYNNSNFINYKATNCLFYNVKFREVGQQLGWMLPSYNNNYKGTLFNRCIINNIGVDTESIFANSGNAYALSPLYNVCSIDNLHMYGGICNGCSINNAFIRAHTTRFNGCYINKDVTKYNNVRVSFANSNISINSLNASNICNNMNVYKSNFRGSNALNFIFCSKDVTINNARIISQPTIWYFNMVANNYTRNIDVNGLYTYNTIFILRNSSMPTISYTRYNSFKLCNLNKVGYIGLNTIAPIINNGTYSREWNVNIKDILISGYMDPRASSFNFYDTSSYNSNTSNAVIFDDNTSRTNIHISNIRVYNSFNVFLAQSFNNTYNINPLIQGKFVNNINCMPVYNNYTSSFNVEYELYGKRSLATALIGTAGVANIGDVLCYNSFISDITVLCNKDLYINIYTSSSYMHHTNAIFAWSTTYNYQNKKGLVNNIRFIQPFEYYPVTRDEFDEYSDPSELPTFGSDILNVHCRCSNIFIPARNSIDNNSMYDNIFNMSSRRAATNFLAVFIGFNRAAFINSRASYTATNNQYCIFSVNMKDYPDTFSGNISNSIVTIDYAGNSFRRYEDSDLESMWDDNVINYSMPTTLRFICNIYNVTPSTTTRRDISFKVNWG